jgi:membrane protein YqaA with SNARE-associated domain
MEAWLNALLTALALPQYGLSTVFVVAVISATLLPLGSEPAVFGLVKLNPDMFWPAILVATAGNTLGGAISWWMGLRRGAVVRTHAPAQALRGTSAYLAGGLWPESLPAVLVAAVWRPTVRCGRLLEAALLALRGLHGDRASLRVT